MNKDSRGVNLVWIELTGLDDFFHFGDRDFAASGGVGIEVARGAAIDQVAMQIGFPRLHDREFGGKASLIGCKIHTG